MSAGRHQTFAPHLRLRKLGQIVEIRYPLALQRLRQHLADLIIAGRTENTVHLRHLLQDLFLVTLCHTAAD